MGRTVVIIPTYNERENLAAVIARVVAITPAPDVLVVDDNSPDGTGQVADELTERHAGVHVLHQPAKAGLGRAYCAGFAWALARGYEFICEMDGDSSHDPSTLPWLIAATRDADLALGTRYRDGGRVVNWAGWRCVLSRGAAVYVRAVSGMPVSDPTSGFKCFRRRALEAVKLGELRSTGYGFQIEVTHRVWQNGGRIVEVPIVFTERAQGHSKMSGAIIAEAIWLVWKLACQNGFRRRSPASVPSP
jgi:dolichol-phosphate mannosyltransferase